MSGGSEKSLVFRGRDAGMIPWTLLGFILLSACVHAFGFFIFQAIYPPAARMTPPPVQVGILNPGTPEADALLRWIDSQDPSRAAEPDKAPIPGLANLRYNPSYAMPRARPAMAPPARRPLPYPDGASGLSLVRMAAARPIATPPPPATAATVLSFAGPLETRPSLPSPPSTACAKPISASFGPRAFCSA